SCSLILSSVCVLLCVLFFCTRFRSLLSCVSFSFIGTAPTETYTLSLHDALPISRPATSGRSQDRPDATRNRPQRATGTGENSLRSEEHTSELQSRFDLVCRLLLEKKKRKRKREAERRKSRKYNVRMSEQIRRGEL